ncbi:hypothetical protein ABID26_003785 [Mesorhizobium shonense]|uniref:Uncharacterized protein n=1 Tax=Mesorhizobium shonense TaxID=1209948 RepID=A0ABV2HW94_9HYPH|nr:hypothetical protein [Mesorhizobium sp.]TIS44707.1 MAG: hypothetical protein E5W96_35075 [Mesorhizobium sp.]
MMLLDVEHGSSSALSASVFARISTASLRSESELEFDGLVEVAADSFEQASDDVGIGHRERGRTAGVWAFSLRGSHCRTVRGSYTGAARWPSGLVARRRA